MARRRKKNVRGPARRPRPSAVPAIVWATSLIAAGIAAYFVFSRLDSGPRNVLLFTVDTLRADRLGSYGYNGATTPHLDRFAAEGVRFANAVAQVPLTLPSHATLFTGTYPAWHGVRDNGGYSLSPELSTLAEIAQAQGYETAGFVSAFVLDSKWGLDRGFDTYFDEFDLSRFERVSLGNVQRIAADTVGAFTTWLSDADEPFFAWVHLYDPHAPYAAPEPYGTDFVDRPYDGEVAYVDSQVGRILEKLDDDGLRENTIVVVTGDHGEGLGEHEELTHGNFVYDSTLLVPLLLRFPRGRFRGRVIEEQVGLIDLFPTLAELFGAEPQSQGQGQSLVPLLRGESVERSPLLAESFYPRLHYGWSEVVALRDTELKYIDAPLPELYDLSADPDEKVNLAAKRAGTVREMRTALRALEASAPGVETERAPIDPETERRLRALGYVGGASPTSDRDRSELPDPKDKLHLIHAIGEADALGVKGRHDEAIEILNGVIAEDPAILDAHLSLGNKFLQLDRYDDAIREFQACLAIDPSYVLAVTNLALTYKEAERYDEARLGFDRVLELDPQNRQAHFNLGEIHLLEKEYEQALSIFKRGLSMESGSAMFLRQSGIAYYYLGDLPKAEKRLAEAIDARDDIEGAHFNLGLVREKQGRVEEAEEHYRTELESHSDNLRAAFNLARLYGVQERYDEQIEVLEELTEEAPDWADAFFHLAKAYRDTGRHDLRLRALETADRALALDPDSTYAPLGHFLRAEMLDYAGRTDEARRAFERGQALARRNP